MKWAMLGLLGIGIGVGVLYWQARSALDERYQAVVSRAGAIGVSRDGRAPDEAQVRRHLEKAAQSAGLELRDVEIEIGGGKLGASAGLQRAVGQQGDALAALPAFGTTIAIQGRLRGKKWLWTLDKPFQARSVIKGDLTPAEGAPKTSADQGSRFEE